MGESTVSAPVAWLTGTVVVVVVVEVLVVEVLVVEVLVGGRAVVAVALGPLDPQALATNARSGTNPRPGSTVQDRLFVLPASFSLGRTSIPRMLAQPIEG
jgi:hypothetical protein